MRTNMPIKDVLIVFFWLWVMGTGCNVEAETRSTLHVAVASSLTEAFQDLETAFEEAVPDQDVILNIAGSQILRLQIEQGIGADVFASANHAHMQTLVHGNQMGRPEVFASNELVILKGPSSPLSLVSVRDLLETQRLVLGTEHSPIGMYTAEMLANADALFGDDFEKKVRSRVVSYENNVRLVRAKVAMGEADAAIVYRTDALSTPEVNEVRLPEELRVPIHYPISIATDAKHPVSARRFMAFVLSNEGQALLVKRGFGVRE